MRRAVLLDLDQTLLPLSVPDEKFIEAYFESLTSYIANLIPPHIFVPAFTAGVDAMLANRGHGPTNYEAFAAVFCPLVGMSSAQVVQALEPFYAGEFARLKTFARPSPDARLIVEWLFSNGYDVAIATGLHLPVSALEERLRWAGIPADEFRYSFLPTAFNIHASKPFVQYYEEVLRRLDRKPGECLMVGDEWDSDIVPATSIGISGYWISLGKELPAEEPPLLLGHGSLSDFRQWLQSGGLART